jgi:hypothetical protein
MRKFGRHDAEISEVGLGGHHRSDAPDEKTAILVGKREAGVFGGLCISLTSTL